MVLKHRGLLKLSTDAKVGNMGFVQSRKIYAVPEFNLAFIGPCLAGNHIHHRRLARTIGTDNGAEFPGFDVEAQAVQRLKSIEANRHTI